MAEEDDDMKRRHHTPEALAIEVEKSMSGDDIVTILERFINVNGAPEFVRMDNGTEMTSNTVAHWCRFSTANISFKDLGSP
jgi:putative transposase